eukprot:1320755-Amorphochlora_amoeboformis.AAC.1
MPQSPNSCQCPLVLQEAVREQGHLHQFRFHLRSTAKESPDGDGDEDEERLLEQLDNAKPLHQSMSQIQWTTSLKDTLGSKKKLWGIKIATTLEFLAFHHAPNRYVFLPGPDRRCKPIVPPNPRSRLGDGVVLIHQASTATTRKVPQHCHHCQTFIGDSTTALILSGNKNQSEVKSRWWGSRKSADTERAASGSPRGRGKKWAKCGYLEKKGSRDNAFRMRWFVLQQ